MICNARLVLLKIMGYNLYVRDATSPLMSTDRLGSFCLQKLKSMILSLLESNWIEQHEKQIQLQRFEWCDYPLSG